MQNKNLCQLCGEKGTNLYGYIICNECKSKLGLFTDDTIGKHISLYKNSTKKRSYEEEIRYRLEYIEKDYIKKRIKLLYIQDRIKELV